MIYSCYDRRVCLAIRFTKGRSGNGVPLLYSLKITVLITRNALDLPVADPLNHRQMRLPLKVTEARCKPRRLNLIQSRQVLGHHGLTRDRRAIKRIAFQE